MAFVISPQQAVEWRRINNLPELDVNSFQAVASGEELAVTGRLEGNPLLTEEGLVAYVSERWDVDPGEQAEDDSEPDEPSGSWNEIETVAPALAIAINGGGVTTVTVTDVTTGGIMMTTPIEQGKGSGSLAADFEGVVVLDGSTRERGYRNGDLITIVGRKTSTGEILPERFYGGDRVALVEEIRQGARFLFMFGIASMICAPIILVIGILSALFGRSQRGVLG